MHFINAMGFRIYSDHLSQIPLEGQCRLISTISPNSYGISTKDLLFRKALKESDFLVLDGVYFALSSILLQGRNVKKNQGPDVFDFFIKLINKRKGKIFFLGSKVSTLEKIKERCSREYPDIEVEFYSPPYKSEFTEQENNAMLQAINDFKPDILFLGMTAPKQEKWAYQHKENLLTKLVISIGGVFDWYAGNEKAIAPIWWKLRLAWLIRTIQRPEILRRYKNILIFFAHLFLALVGIKKFRNGTF